MDDDIDAIPAVKVEVPETVGSKEKKNVAEIIAMIDIHQSLLNSGYNAITRSVKGELCLEKNGVGKIIVRPDSQNNSQIEILTMAYTEDGVTVEDTVQTLVRDSDKLKFSGEPQKIPMGLRWPVKIVS